MPPLIVRGRITRESWEKTWLTKNANRQESNRTRFGKQATRLIAKGKKNGKKSRSVWTVSGGLPETNRRTH